MNMHNSENKIALVILVTFSTVRFKSKLEWIWNDFVTFHTIIVRAKFMCRF